ncbi:MAG: NeuD/PglB/VioB family sugar acetyltransferase [Cyclobacteriaceae bacterium]|nr:NeuD/PglB/VioB family sugar acetyltransferase [Cyclobacteriaceae bacterium]MCH8516026.1 NeuD/PglB/VioB family sugar acetyltransferase [Cyclobacteriaceae bacterium]
MEKAVMILGAGAIGRAAMEIFKSNGIEVFCFLDDDASLHGTEIDDVSILGKTTDDGYLKYIGKKCEVFVASDENKIRKKMVDLLLDRRKTMPINAIHATAYVSESAQIGYGNFINMGTKIGSGVDLGAHSLLHSQSLIDHGVKAGEFLQLGAGAIIGSQATIGKNVFVGSGAVIVPGVTIGDNARIGAGSVVVANVDKGKTVFGNPASVIE